MKYWQKREMVRDLRSDGLSYREIRQKTPFAISKSTISEWCKDIKLTLKQKERLDRLFREGSYRGRLLGSKATQARRAREIKEIKEEARKQISLLSKKEFKLAGLMLYWAEGAKDRYIDITNSDPALIKFMTNWLRIICKVPKERFRASLHLHSGQNERKIKRYWSKLTNIPVRHFSKSYIKKEGSGYRKNKLYNGTIKIRVCDSNLLHKILGWIEGVSENKWAISSIGRAVPS